MVKLNIAFCVNRLALIGLGVTLSSLIRNCSDSSRLHLYILYTDWISDDILEVERLLQRERFIGNVTFIHFNAVKTFGQFRSLHGDWTPYGRLLLSSLINEETILYLDADLVVEIDILSIKDVEISDPSPLSAVEAGQLQYTLENKFYIEKLHLSPTAKTFNSGVLLFNLTIWREKNIFEECIKIAEQYPNDLLSCDQTILNALFSDNFSKLPKNFNSPWYAHSSKPKDAEKMILHFVGSPKPWDPGAVFIHNGYKTWSHYLDPFWKKKYAKINIDVLKRAWQIRRSYTKRIIGFFKK